MRYNKEVVLISLFSVQLCFIGCLPEKSRYQEYVSLKEKKAERAYNTIMENGYLSVPFLIEALASEKQFVPYDNYGILSPRISSKLAGSIVQRYLNRGCIYELRGGDYLAIYKWYVVTPNVGLKALKQIFLVEAPKDTLFLGVTELPTISRLAHFLLSKILNVDMPWPGNSTSAKDAWGKIWSQHKGNIPFVSTEYPENKREAILQAIRDLEFDGPYYDVCENMFCRLMLEQGGDSIGTILRWSNSNRRFNGMCKIEVRAETLKNKADAEQFLQHWNISKDDYDSYLFELRSEEYLLIYTKMCLFKDMPGSCMITTYQDGSDGRTRYINAAHILLKMITGKSVDWETGRDAQKTMIKKWKQILKHGTHQGQTSTIDR